MKSIVITGASTGIGEDAARLLTQHGFRVFGSVRKPADAERLRRTLGEAFTPLLFDVTDEAAVQTAAGQIRTMLGGENNSTYKAEIETRVPSRSDSTAANVDLVTPINCS